LKHRSRGLSFAKISKKIGVSRKTLIKWNEDFGFEVERFKAKEIKDGRLKEKPKVINTLNKKLYYGKHYVRRTIILKHLYLSNVENVVRFEFNICEVGTENPNYPFAEMLKWAENATQGITMVLKQKI